MNNWIRTSGEYDGVIDFDAVTRDPAAPSKFAAFADSGDHLHPGDAGYQAMGEPSISLCSNSPRGRGQLCPSATCLRA